jgi:hypothetical protein
MEPAGRLIGTLHIAQDQEAAGLRACAAWKRAAGKKVAEHTRALALVRGKLVVEVDDAVLQRNLAGFTEILTAHLNRELGEDLVSGLDLRPISPRRGPQRAETARPAAAADEADRIADPVMRGVYRESRRKQTA